MREILFRGKSKFDKNNKWVYGDLIQGENTYISTKEEFYSAVVSLGGHLSTFVELVDKETLGQYTGLKDKNGTKIFGGDILIGDIPELLGSQNLIGIVEYEESSFIIRIPNRKSWQIQKVGFCSFINYKVIGNIYDNPELLEGDDVKD